MAELQAAMDAEEFGQWQAWLELHPYGKPLADDLRWAVLILATLNANRKEPVAPGKIFPHLAVYFEEPEQAPALLKAMAQAWAESCQTKAGPVRAPAPAQTREKPSTLR